MPGYLGSAQISMGAYLYDVSIDAGQCTLIEDDLLAKEPTTNEKRKNALVFTDFQWVTFHMDE
jgi:hypothetical protein